MTHPSKIGDPSGNHDETVDAAAALGAAMVPSMFDHPLYSVDWSPGNGYTAGGETRTERGTSHSPARGAEVVASTIVGTRKHTLMLDIDVPATLLPSSTEGHAHLYIDVEMSWRKYRRVVKALAKAGIVEPAYYRASASRRHTALRLPGIGKTRDPVGNPHR